MKLHPVTCSRPFASSFLIQSAPRLQEQECVVQQPLMLPKPMVGQSHEPIAAADTVPCSSHKHSTVLYLKKLEGVPLAVDGAATCSRALGREREECESPCAQDDRRADH